MTWQVQEKEKVVIAHVNKVVYLVYKIVDPRDGKPFYVGQTKNLRKRALDHLKIVKSLKKQKNKNKRLMEILEAGLEPKFVPIYEVYTREDALKIEKEYTLKYAKEGHTIYASLLKSN